MLEFSDARYQFFAPAPSRPVIWAARTLNGAFVLPGKEHRISEIRIEGETEALRDVRSRGERLLFVINHPTHSDPQVITEVHRRLGIPSCFMAAYDVFLRSKLTEFVMRRTGNFSIDREGSDRKAMSTAIEVLTKGEFALNIYPEGNVYLTNDRVTPFLDGTAFIALKAQKDLGETPVKIVPISLKFTHLTEPRKTVTDRMLRLAADSEYRFDPDVQPMEAVLGLGTHILARYLAQHGYSREMSDTAESLFDRLAGFADELVGRCEGPLGIESREGARLVDRIRKVRSTIHQMRISENAPHPQIDGLAERAILAFRVHGYLTPYLTETPTIDRYDETVERICEDFYSRNMPRTGPRRAVATIHPPLDTRAFLESAGGKLKDAVIALTAETERAVQAGLDDINTRNDAPGAQRVEEA